MKRINYDDISAVYDRRYRSGCPSGIAEALWALAHRVKARCVLEAGWGTGYWLALMEGCDIRCGLDYSAGMLDKARQRAVSLDLVRGTVTGLPFPEAAFDFVFCVHALHHFDDPSAFIEEARRVLRTGGALAIVGMDPQAEGDRWYLYKDGMSQLSLLTEDAFLDGMTRIEEAIRLAEGHGREVVFPMDIVLPIAAGFASDATQDGG